MHRIVLAGAGGMGRTHARGIEHLRHEDGRPVEITWVVDPDKSARDKLAAQIGARPAPELSSEVLSGADGLINCTPHPLHHPVTLKALEAGLHCLVEKPMAMNEAQALEMTERAEELELCLMVGYVRRFQEACRRTKELLDAQAYGPPLTLNAWTHHYLQPRPNSWFARHETLGGGSLFSHGCHYIDLILWFLGDPAQAAGFSTRLLTEWLEDEGTSQTIMKFPSGALASYSCSWGTRYSRGGGMDIHCENGTLLLDYTSLEVITNQGRQRLYGPDEAPMVAGELHHFLDCIASGHQPETHGHEALRSLRLIWHVYETADETGRLPEGML